MKAPKFVEGSEDWKWEPIDQISFSITADHRIIGRATCARFSQLIKSYIENPNLMLLTKCSEHNEIEIIELLIKQNQNLINGKKSQVQPDDRWMVENKIFIKI